MTSSDPEIDRLQRVDLREIWPNEATDFTPWLAKEENLQILCEALDNLTLETEAVEKEVGSFKADIVCRDVDEDLPVLIENQLGPTDHDHLGKLLTYSAGLRSFTVVWIAQSIRPEHRAALDWLNQISNEHCNFFGLEIELWRIGASNPAPKFNVVSKPNNWSRRVSQTLEDTEPTPFQILQSKYWERFLTYFGENYDGWNTNRKPRAQHWMTWNIGNSGFNLTTVIGVRDRFLRLELYIERKPAEVFLGQLQQISKEIENELGFELVWGDQGAQTQSKRISYYYRDVDVDDESDWDNQHRWLADHLIKFRDVFKPRIQNLDTIYTVDLTSVRDGAENNVLR